MISLAVMATVDLIGVHADATCQKVRWPPWSILSMRRSWTAKRSSPSPMCRPASAGCPRSCCTSGMALPIMHLIARGTQRFSEGGAGAKVDGSTGPTASGSPVRLSPRRLFRCRQTCTGGSRGRRPPEHDNKLSPALDMIRKEGCILADAGKQGRLAFRKPRQANEVKPRDLGDPALVDGPSGLPGAPCRKDR